MVQPGARPGDTTYCPVSGVVFRVEEGRPHREVAGRTLYFCCESCADHFSRHAEAVLAARGIRPE